MYLYNFEDGSMWQYQTHPTEDDIAAVADGIMIILKFEDGVFLEIDGIGNWSAVEKR